MTIQCFWLEPTGKARRFFRRFTFSATGVCPLTNGYGHNASVAVGEAPLRFTAEGYIDALEVDKNDSRWPCACACGYVFADTDMWQHNQEPLYTALDGREYSIRFGDAPPGAMWHAPWLSEEWRGTDGLSLVLRLPDGHDWFMDGPSRDGGHWERRGSPPNITANPSILSPGYHGWLNNGILSDDLDGRRY